MSQPNYLFSRNNVRCLGKNSSPVLVTDYAPRGQAYSHDDELPGLKITARAFVTEHLRGTAEEKGLPRLSTDETVTEDLFTVAFHWLTSGISPAVIEVASLIRELEKRGVKIPEIRYGSKRATLV